MKIPKAFWFVLIPLVLGATVLISQGPRARVVPVIRPSFFQAPSDLGYWTYRQIRPRLLAFDRIRIFAGPGQEALVEDLLGGFTSEAHKDQLGFRFVTAVGQWEGVPASKRGPKQIEFEILPEGAFLRELPTAKTLVIVLFPYGQFKEELDCETDPGPRPWSKELKCLVKVHARKFQAGKVKGSGLVAASVDLVAADVYAVTFYSDLGSKE